MIRDGFLTEERKAHATDMREFNHLIEDIVLNYCDLYGSADLI
jgi:hypothetical protein